MSRMEPPIWFPAGRVNSPPIEKSDLDAMKNISPTALVSMAAWSRAYRNAHLAFRTAYEAECAAYPDDHRGPGASGHGALGRATLDAAEAEWRCEKELLAWCVDAFERAAAEATRP